jgi:hypothetical protein
MMAMHMDGGAMLVNLSVRVTGNRNVRVMAVLVDFSILIVVEIARVLCDTV